MERSVVARDSRASLSDEERPVRMGGGRRNERSDGGDETKREPAHDFLLGTTPLIRRGAPRRSEQLRRKYSPAPAPVAARRRVPPGPQAQQVRRRRSRFPAH